MNIEQVEIVDVDGSVEFRFHELTIRGLADSDNEELNQWGNRVPITVTEGQLEAYGIPGDYGLRPSLYKNSFVSVGVEQDRLVGVTGLCAKRIILNGKIREICYGIDGIIHPDFRSKGYVHLISLRNSFIALQNGVPMAGSYGSVSSSNIPSIRSCYRIGMKYLFKYDRLICTTEQWKYYQNEKPPTNDITVIKDPNEAAELLIKDFGTLDFFPIDANEITDNIPFMGTLVLKSGNNNNSAMISIWDMNYTSTTIDASTKEKLRGYFLFGGTGDIELLSELIRRIGAWSAKQSHGEKTYIVINTCNIADPLAQAWYNVVPTELMKGMAYQIMFTDSTKGKITFGYQEDKMNNNIDNLNTIQTNSSKEETIENMFKNNNGNTKRSKNSKYTFFDPRDNGILLIPKDNVYSKIEDLVTSPLIKNTKSKL